MGCKENNKIAPSIMLSRLFPFSHFPLRPERADNQKNTKYLGNREMRSLGGISKANALSQDQVQAAEDTWSCENAEPKDDVAQPWPATQPFRPAQLHQLQAHGITKSASRTNKQSKEETKTG
jgi:hypothetical protein